MNTLIPSLIAVTLSVAAAVACDLRGGPGKRQGQVQVSLGGFIMVEPGSASLRAVALGTGESFLVMFIVFAVAVGEGIPIGWITMTGSTVV